MSVSSGVVRLFVGALSNRRCLFASTSFSPLASGARFMAGGLNLGICDWDWVCMQHCAASNRHAPYTSATDVRALLNVDQLAVLYNNRIYRIRSLVYCFIFSPLCLILFESFGIYHHSCGHGENDYLDWSPGPPSVHPECAHRFLR